MAAPRDRNGAGRGGFGKVPGRRATKTPTGKRPVPKVAKSSLPPMVEPAAPHYPTPTPMPKPKMRWGKRGGGKPHGGK
jgi:hypothetical protein